MKKRTNKLFDFISWSLESISFEIINYDECSMALIVLSLFIIYIFFRFLSLVHSLAHSLKFHCHTFEISLVSVKLTNDKWFRRISAFDKYINHIATDHSNVIRGEAFWKNNEICLDVIEMLAVITLPFNEILSFFFHFPLLWTWKHRVQLPK